MVGVGGVDGDLLLVVVVGAGGYGEDELVGHCWAEFGSMRGGDRGLSKEEWCRCLAW